MPIREFKRSQCEKCRVLINPAEYKGLYCPVCTGKLEPDVVVRIWDKDGETGWVFPGKSRFSTQVVDEESDH